MNDEDIKKLREELEFQKARAELMELCDCGLYYFNIKWVLDYVKDNITHSDYYGAREYTEKALMLWLEDKELDFHTKEILKHNGLFLAVGEKMLRDIQEDLSVYNLALENVNLQSDASSIAFSQGYFEKQCFIEEYENSKAALNDNLLLCKHEAFLENLGILDDLIQAQQEQFSQNTQNSTNKIRKR